MALRTKLHIHLLGDPRGAIPNRVHITILIKTDLLNTAPHGVPRRLNIAQCPCVIQCFRASLMR